MPQWLVELFARYGYFALFAGVFLENLGIPVPGETALLAAGFLARQGVLRLAIVLPCAMIAASLGDNFGYWIGRRGGRAFIARYGKYVGLTEKRLVSVETYFREHGPRAVFFARFISGIRVMAALAAGVSRMPWRQFLIYNSAGAVVWSTTIGLLGYFFGHSFPLIERWIGRTGLIVLVVVFVAFFLAWRHRRRA